MDAPLSLYLARFAPDDPGSPLVTPHIIADRAPPEPARPVPVAESLVTLTVADLDARLAAARRAAEADAASAHETALAALAGTRASELEAALAAARDAWAAGEGRAAAAALDAVASLRELLVDKVADVLRPLMARAMAERACVAVGAALDQVLDDPDQPCLTVSGPADLLEAIRAAWPAPEGQGGRITYVVTDTPDVTVSARATRIETRLGAALAALDASAHAASHAVVEPEIQP